MLPAYGSTSKSFTNKKVQQIINWERVSSKALKKQNPTQKMKPTVENATTRSVNYYLIQDH